MPKERRINASQGVPDQKTLEGQMEERLMRWRRNLFAKNNEISEGKQRPVADPVPLELDNIRGIVGNEPRAADTIGRVAARFSDKDNGSRLLSTIVLFDQPTAALEAIDEVTESTRQPLDKKDWGHFLRTQMRNHIAREGAGIGHDAKLLKEDLVDTVSSASDAGAMSKWLQSRGARPATAEDDEAWGRFMDSN